MSEHCEQASAERAITAPSVLAADFTRIGDAVSRIERSGADWIHIDIMDGHFVPNITFGAKMVADIRAITRLPLDVHLMIENPRSQLDNFAKAGANLLTFHIETVVHSHSLARDIQALGLKAGVSLVPSTPVSALECILPFVDLVLVMTVNPGVGGQALIPECLDKVERLKEIRREKNLPYLISIDGGIKADNASAARHKGADVLVAGSAFFEAPSAAEFIRIVQCSELKT
ncbi:MAG: ribulose-phosphate 3-epimerase [Spirochaetaceae bacterium]|jgi:ribulose-phosphate 3-epimerase|nr:ribulose-phosphate 3-epimerase [Spirochaetaceae bacterium]